VFVYTDASDYGISAYVCQRCRINGEEKEFAIGYYSRALTPQEQRWTTIEKECYAIVATFKKFDYLLRDISFTLYTDHRNLTFLKTPPSPKVLRWKLCIQSYNCRVHHLRGETNVVADAFSRLMEPQVEEAPTDLVLLNREETRPLSYQRNITT
jgi:hypothetical protein